MPLIRGFGTLLLQFSAFHLSIHDTFWTINYNFGQSSSSRIVNHNKVQEPPRAPKSEPHPRETKIKSAPESKETKFKSGNFWMGISLDCCALLNLVSFDSGALLILVSLDCDALLILVLDTGRVKIFQTYTNNSSNCSWVLLEALELYYGSLFV
eukprot:sb/3473261/